MLAYSPMFHARLFKEQARFRDAHFQPTKESLTSKKKSDAPIYLDGRSDIDRPLFVQFCANKEEDFFEAAQYVAPYCDAVDLNLGCPQGIAKSGHYGAFLQEDWDTIHKLIRKLRDELDVPVTAKFRILETREKTLEYAKMLLDAGASIITCHGRQRHQKGHNTGVADWETIRFLRDSLPPETVLFANGNILNNNDIGPCLEATKADGIMSAEGNLCDPTIFAGPPEDPNSREYWRDRRDPSIGGYRIDGVFRRYMDIIHRYVLEQEPPQRQPLYVPSDSQKPAVESITEVTGETDRASEEQGTKRSADTALSEDVEPEKESPSKKSKKQKTKRNNKDLAAVHNPNLKAMQGHLFQLLRPLIGLHVPIRDALARSRAGNIQAFEDVLSMVEEAVRKGLDEEYATLNSAHYDPSELKVETTEQRPYTIDKVSSESARERCRRPFWVCQPHIRPLPEEAVKLGAMTLSKKDKQALEKTNGVNGEMSNNRSVDEEGVSHEPQEKSQAAVAEDVTKNNDQMQQTQISRDLPKEEALACG